MAKKFCKRCNKWTENDDCGVLGQPHGALALLPNGNVLVRGAGVSTVTPLQYKKLVAEGIVNVPVESKVVTQQILRSRR
jgi:hypothetical protein